jgi:hypothetical protein
MLYAVLGTFISAFFIGYCTLSLGRLGWVDIDTSNPVEALLFGTLISAVSCVAVRAPHNSNLAVNLFLIIIAR